MKKRSINFYLTALLVVVLAITLTPKSVLAQKQIQGLVYTDDDAYVSYNDFYQELAPYGQWIDDPNYGYVWSPNVDGTFRPYFTNGYWAMTEYGNTWVSNYSWGWACFHYGRWTFDQYYGWIWIPGSAWGPAWVCWRAGSGQYGWAPLSPGYELTSGNYYCPNDWWVFIQPQYLYSGKYYRYWTGPRGNRDFIANTDFSNNSYVSNSITYVSGPKKSDIEQDSHLPVHVYHLEGASNRDAFVHQDEIKFFRPAEVKPQRVEGERMVPPNVITGTRTVSSKPQPVNSHAGTNKNFKADVNNAEPPVTSAPIITPHTADKHSATPIKADPYPYKTDINTNDAQLKPPPPDPAKENFPVKPQGPQNPEPVRYQPRQNNEPTPAAQQVETVHPNNQPGRNGRTAPSQQPEPVRGKK